jgi:importin-4
VEGLLLQVTSAQDTAVLKRATKELSGTFYKSDICIPVLVHILQHSQNTAVRQLAAVEARKLVPKFWQETFAPQIRNSLLQSTLAEQDPKTRHASARLVSAIGKQDMKDGKWPELSVFCQEASTSARVTDREVGLYVIYTLLESEPDLFEGRMEELLRLFSITIHDPESREVRQTTLLSLGELSSRIYDNDKAMYAFFHSFVDSSIKTFREMLPPMTSVVKQAIEADHESDARDAFEVFENLLIVVNIFMLDLTSGISVSVQEPS